MLNRITLGNFKCFESLSLNLAPLTLFTGFNAAGKSTALQSLLLLAQRLRFGGRSPEIPLNGSLARLGTPGEVLHSGSGGVVFSMEDDKAKIEWVLHAEDRTSGQSLKVRRIGIVNSEGTKQYDRLSALDNLLPDDVGPDVKAIVEILKKLVFLSTVRRGTDEVFPFPEIPVLADVGPQGEFAPYWFQRFLDEEIDPLRCHPSDSARTLRRQFNAWAGELFPGAQGNAYPIDKTNLVCLQLRIGSIGDWCRPSNIGYGLTYAFPVLVAGLLAKSGQILIIDSPEAHLHSEGQSKMGRFLAAVASAGVQVILETHSDHILNGIRLSVRDEKIDPDKVAPIFFSRGKNVAQTGVAQVFAPSIDPSGNLSEWPTGFFDQSEKDLANLAGWN